MTRRPEQRWRQSAEKGEKSILTMSELASMFSALLNWLCHCCTPSIHGLSTARLLLAQPEAILLVTEPKCLQKGAGQAAPPVGAPSLSSSSRWWSRLHQALAQLALAASCTCGSRRRAWFSAVSSKTSQAHAVRSCVDRWTSACWARAESPSPLGLVLAGLAGIPRASNGVGGAQVEHLVSLQSSKPSLHCWGWAEVRSARSALAVCLAHQRMPCAGPREVQVIVPRAAA